MFALRAYLCFLLIVFLAACGNNETPTPETITPETTEIPTADETDDTEVQSVPTSTETATMTVTTMATTAVTATPTMTVSPTATSTICSVRTDWQIYIVVSGDTLSNLAVRTNSTVANLKTANCKTSDTIIVGESLRVPQRPASTAVPTATSTKTNTPPPTATNVPTIDDGEGGSDHDDVAISPSPTPCNPLQPETCDGDDIEG